jgi:hypothetical protein
VEGLRDELSTAGLDVDVRAMVCDISKMSEVKQALDEHARARRPPIKGIIHGGMELKVSAIPAPPKNTC